MLSRIKSRIRPPPQSHSQSQPQSTSNPTSFNQSKEQLSASSKLQRTQRAKHLIYNNVGWIRSGLIVLGCCWLLILPVEQFGKGTYMDENAISPAQVTTYYTWSDVHSADTYLKSLEQLHHSQASSEQRAGWISTELQKLGLRPSTQEYSFQTSFGTNKNGNSSSLGAGAGAGAGKLKGINTYATLSPPRSPSTETILLVAPWISLSKATPETSYPYPYPKSTSSSSNPNEEENPERLAANLRGTALLLSIARFLRGQNHWSKEFVFLFAGGVDPLPSTDGGIGMSSIDVGGSEGVEAFLSAWHGISSSSPNNKSRQPLTTHNSRGVIWQALNIDYPGHSFSHLGLYYEGVNGRLPNQDLLNAVSHIGYWNGGVGVRLYSLDGDLQQLPCPSYLPSLLCSLINSNPIKEYKRGIQHLATHFSYAGLGRGSGAHSVFAKYRIDAVTLFAEPAMGPHGFHSLGTTIESTLRSLNNILERLHASYFFYLMPRHGLFLVVGQYLPAAIILSASITFGGLKDWIDAGWVLKKSKFGEQGKDLRTRWVRRSRGLDQAVWCLGVCFIVGMGIFKCLTAKFLPSWVRSAVIWASIPMIRDLPSLILLPIKSNKSPALAYTLSALIQILAGAIISALAMVNFPQSILLLAILLPSFLLSSPSSKAPDQLIETGQAWPSWAKKYRLLALSPACLNLIIGGLGVGEWPFGGLVRLIDEWEILGNWTAPGLFVIVWPLQLAASIVLTLS